MDRRVSPGQATGQTPVTPSPSPSPPSLSTSSPGSPRHSHHLKSCKTMIRKVALIDVNLDLPVDVIVTIWCCVLVSVSDMSWPGSIL